LFSLSAKSQGAFPLWLPLLIIILGWGCTRFLPTRSAANFLPMRWKRFAKRKSQRD